LGITTSFRDLARKPGFHAFLWTQLLSAFNDNVYKMIVSLRVVHIAAATGSSSEYLALTGAAFVIPFLLFSGYSGHLADAVSKRRILIGVKAFEVLVMGFGIAAFFSPRIEWMLLVLLLMALRATVFSPAKYGLVPEIVPDEDLSRANALLEMITFAAIVMGTSAGAFLFARWGDEPWKMGVAMLAIAAAGLSTSFKITPVPAAGTKSPFRFNPFAEIAAGTKHVLRDRTLWLTVLAISYFWFLGLLVQMNLLLFGSEVLHVDDFRIGMMVTCLAIGTGAGSMLAGRLSGPKVEPGLVAVGSLFIALFSFALYLAKGSYLASSVALFCLGVSSGLYFVPLNAYLQKRSNGHEKGRVIATANFYGTVGLLLAPGALWVLHDWLRVAPAALFAIFGLVTLAVTAYLVFMEPEFPIRFGLWMTAHTLFKIRIAGRQNLPLRGPALLVANHISHADGFLIAACMQRFIRFMIWKPYFEVKFFAWFFRLAKAIPAGTAGPRDVVESLRRARKELEAGHVVCIFAEGSISRTGNLLPFKRGLEKIVDRLDVPVIPVHLDGLWGTVFSFEGGKFFWKWPRKFRPAVTISFGQPMPASATVQQARQAILELSANAAEQRKTSGDVLPLRFIRRARKNWRKFAISDSSGQELTYGQALAKSLLIANQLRKGHVSMIGVLLPPSVEGVLANIAVSMSGRIPVNLNFAAGREAMASAIGQCGIDTTLTSRAFLSEANIEAPAGAVFVEDILASASPFAKFRALLAARMMPARTLVGSAQTPDSTATVIFLPRGVMLSHYNVISNIEAVTQVFWIGPQDRLTTAHPFFDALGFTMTIWLPLITGCGAVYQCHGSVLTFGSKVLDGYGCAEMSALISVNVPDFEAGKETQLGTKPGTVGHPLPGVAVKVVDPVTLETLSANEEGLLMVRGPNHMKGYLDQPARPDWFATRDIASVDEDGFIHIADRLVQTTPSDQGSLSASPVTSR